MPGFDECLGQIAAALGSDQYEHHLKQGRAMTYNQLITYATYACSKVT